MFRRCISILLLLGFVASQLAAVPHAHAGRSDAGHDAHPHVHLAWFCHDHHGEREHDHDSHESTPGRSIGTDREHDCDAVYLSRNPLRNQSVETAVSDMRSTAVATLPVAVPSSFLLSEQPSPVAADALPSRAPNCALYLTLRALRI